MTPSPSSGSPYDSLIVDLVAEGAALTSIVSVLDEVGLDTATPALGWSIRDQLSHLAGFDEAGRQAVEDPDGFTADLNRRVATGDDPIAGYTATGRTMPAPEVVAWWVDSRERFVEAVRSLDPKHRVPWYGPPMSAMSHVTARLMETWAHGQDVRDALGLDPEVTARLRHVAHIGIGARTFSFLNCGKAVPDDAIAVRLSGPAGEKWEWGPDDAENLVAGDAIDFCLVVTQRRHLDDVSLEIVGPTAGAWMAIAQAFAGAPGGGRAPLGGGRLTDRS